MVKKRKKQNIVRKAGLCVGCFVTNVVNSWRNKDTEKGSHIKDMVLLKLMLYFALFYIAAFPIKKCRKKCLHQTQLFGVFI